MMGHLRAWTLVGAVAVLAVGTIAWALWPAERPSLGEATARQEDGGITVTAVRHASGNAFTLAIETHTVDLSAYDPVASARLATNHGEHAPSSGSEVTKNDGHHIEARLVFDVAPAAGDALVLRGLGGREWRLVFG